MSSTAKTTFLAKITRPEAPDVVVRRRLVQHLDEAARRPIVWLTSPGGSGKTTLVSSYLQERRLPCIWYQCDAGDNDLATFFYYMAQAVELANPGCAGSLPLLTPEYLAGLPTFTRRYFEELYGGLLHAASSAESGGSKFCIVFDNYQEVPAAAHFHEMLVQGLEVLPPGINIVVISRHEPPPPFARLRANNRMSRIGWEEIRFTLEETTEVISGGLGRDLSCEYIREVHERADGWIAAIVLILGQGSLSGAGGEFYSGVASEEIFDYFAAEILNESPHELREFLLQTAFLPTISVALAKKLTGSDEAARLLAALHRQNYFTERLSGTGAEYRYHPLFRDFLMARAKAEIAPPQLAVILVKAARILTESGRIEDAAVLLVETGDWSSLSKLLVDQARSFIVEGRNQTLESYLRKLPQEILAATPELLYWLGICRMPFDIEESRALLERAFQAFNSVGDRAGAIKVWAAVVDSLVTEHNDYTKFDPWLTWLDDMADDLPTMALETEREVVAYMLFALTFHQPWHPRITWWRERAEALLRLETNLAGAMIVGARLLLHYTFFGAIHQAEFMLKNIRPPASGKVGMAPLALIQWEVINAIHAALGSGSISVCLDAVNRGLTLSREKGIRVFEPMFLYYGAVGAALSGEETSSNRYLTEMVGLRAKFNEMNLAYYLSALAWRDLLQGDAKSAAERIGMILPITDQRGFTVNALSNHIGLAQALFELGETEQARSHLDQVRERVGSEAHWFRHAVLLTEAYFAFRQGREEEGLALATQALALSRQTGVTVFVYWRPALTALVCTKALAAGIETEYVQGLIKKLHLLPDPSSPVPAAWPWPLKIITMGGLRILLEGEPLGFSRKTPQKPLDLLKALIAFGGRNVPVEKITEALWPEADGDLALKSLETNVRRLRRLLGVDQSVGYSGRQLYLDQRFCWVDCIALDEVLGPVGEFAAAEIPRKYREAVELYQGHFLPTDGDREWVVTRGELLKNRMLGLLGATGRLLIEQGKWPDAVDCYCQGLAIDALVEEFYLQLLLCYQKLGHRAEAVQLYGRCRHQLKTHLGITPSPEIEAEYAKFFG